MARYKYNIDSDKIYYTKIDNDPYKIIKEYDEHGDGINRKCRIKFLNTGYEYDVYIRFAITGKVKDPYSFDFKILNDNNIYHSNNSGDFYYVRAIPAILYQHRRVIIHFIDTGTEVEVQYSCAQKGAVKDPYKPLKSGLVVGIPKKLYPEHIMKNLYSKWKGIGDRCYCKDSTAYKYYGAKGVKVCKEWLLFETFIETIHLVEGFDKYLSNPSEYEIDKDIKQQNTVQKIYSPQTCMFVHHRMNMCQAINSRSKNYYFGVTLTANGMNYRVTLDNKYIGTFSNNIAAANAYNYFATKYNLPVLLNNVQYMAVEEWSSYYTKYKEMCRIVQRKE